MNKMASHLCTLLSEIVEKHKLDLPIVAVLSGRIELDENEREILIDALVCEFSETGIQADDEPNKRGEEIEMIIDFFGPAQRPKGD